MADDRRRAHGDRARGDSARGDSVEALVAGAIERSVSAMFEHEAGVRAGDDVEAVHQYRVATRRLRSDLQTFGPFLDPAAVREVRAELRWLGGVVGAVRDAEVLRDRLRGRAADGRGVEVGAAAVTEAAREAAAVERLLAELEARWCAARADLEEALGSPRYAAAMDLVRRAGAAPPFAAGTRAARRKPAAKSAVLRRVVRSRWRGLRTAVAALPAEPPDADLHQVRILAKRCRYAAEAVAPAFGREAHAFADGVAGLQTVLGEHQDAVIAEKWLRAARDRPAPGAGAGIDADADADAALAAAIDAMLRREAKAHRAARRAWPKAWKRASSPRRRRWL